MLGRWSLLRLGTLWEGVGGAAACSSAGGCPALQGEVLLGSDALTKAMEFRACVCARTQMPVYVLGAGEEKDFQIGRRRRS